MTDPNFEESFLTELDRTRKLTASFVRMSIDKDPDAYPFVLEMLNEVLQAGIDAATIGGSEPETLRSIAHQIKAVLNLEDEPSAKFITVV